ncbi:M14 family zinc carboxypeptidase [Autumnicola edwardsiae]|uniref:M14 family zinc carboxypeptidase n=1 Tax=Autumnicola edwardsiae TaxID=3075594 RepID=A0ABU3CWN9_9FLAO|nr:M14 family zinc carboxypeptidase [Zunongwangia sp. F297]MDT0650653.1 M14 family zinc carboxypeptidase [Zunongwangia sp. F297]
MFTIVKSIIFTFVSMKNYPLHLQKIMQGYTALKNQKISGRYLNLDHITPELEKLTDHFTIEKIGESALGESISVIKTGNGKIRILAWSQMHGNESTTTKAVFDLLNAFKQKKDFPVVEKILQNCEIWIISILNPDGARSYTRVNANNVDLNRDAQHLQEVESRILRKQFDRFSPHFCLNLHDQRTIFTAGDQPKPATLSFLTPSMDEERKITASRKISMQVISAIVRDLEKELPGQIGRYDDAFNLNCTGDTFQSEEVPTILFEAGHYQDDYMREVTRKYVFAALISALHAIATGNYNAVDFKKYEKIPENQKLYNDVVLRNCTVNRKKVDVSIQFKERLEHNKINFDLNIERIQPNVRTFGLREVDCKGNELALKGENGVGENVLVEEIFLNEKKLDLKP